MNRHARHAPLGGALAVLVLALASYACEDPGMALDAPSQAGANSDSGASSGDGAPASPGSDAGSPTDAGDAGDAEPGFSPNSTKVCPTGCDYTVPSEAVAAAQNGALIEIQAGDYADCFAIHADNVTVRGIGGYVHLHTKICDGKAIVVTYGQNTTLERLELSDFANAEYNGAGVRHDAAAKNLTLKRSFIHDGQLGILASSTGDTITIDSTTFQHVGFLRPDGEISVPLYVTGAATLNVRASRFLQGVGGASMIKSRAGSTTIACSVIANLDGPDSYNVDLQTGGDFALLNSVIEQSAQTENQTMLAYGSSSFDPNTAKSFVVQGTTFINDASGGTFVKLFNGSPQTFDVSGNTFIGPGTPVSGGGTVGTNQQADSRPAAIGAYPNLPEPGPCP